jgi:hypothetical protein
MQSPQYIFGEEEQFQVLEPYESSDSIFRGERIDEKELEYPYSEAESVFEQNNAVPFVKASEENYTGKPQFIRRLQNGKAFVVFTPDTNKAISEVNQKQVDKCGVSLADIQSALAKTVDLKTIQQLLDSHAQLSQADPYDINQSSAARVDAVFTEAVHQFQCDNYIDANEQDGIIGVSTLDTLGLFNNKLRRPLSSAGFYGQKELNKIKKEISQATNGEFTADNWFQFIYNPAWLGVKITDGIHLALLRKLKEAEAWLVSQPQYKGMTPAALGRALGLAGKQYSCARLSADNQAMHGVGLAIDIDGYGNPWIGGGWITAGKGLSERERFLDVLKQASGEKLPGDTIFAYLHSIAIANGKDTAAAFSVLKQKNDQFINYLKGKPTELNYWKTSFTFDIRSPLSGFLNHHPDLVVALRQQAGLAWGAIDFGSGASGDIMHFDLRTLGVGIIIATQIHGFVPDSKNHPAVEQKETFEAFETKNDWEFHEAINEGEWQPEVLETQE